MINPLRLSIFKWLVTAFLIGISLYVAISEPVEFLSSPDEFRSTIRDAGIFGPAVIVVSIAIAVVISPIPSAPITAISGAAYGHLWGTVYALVGAQLGAMIAFFITRKFGRGPIGRLTAKLEFPKGLSSQNALTTAVFLARLVPAVSFDAVSYLAGLTPLSTFRFALATLIGMIPMTFLFSHIGDAFVTGDNHITDWVAFFVAISIVVLGVVWIKLQRKGQSPESSFHQQTIGGGK